MFELKPGAWSRLSKEAEKENCVAVAKRTRKQNLDTFQVYEGYPMEEHSQEFIEDSTLDPMIYGPLPTNEQKQTIIAEPRKRRTRVEPVEGELDAILRSKGLL
ncbi:hypothetical protein [endosymbiont of Ridgeia piscesae]|nr:hypothetical protein [endosymbiont of Ridgeia piscesae]